ncbi:hypothetical protein [Sinimarinibacterium thermocellulolyticum]|uniref:Uncharacterized protein n=1 Tax=Sinimarinibacterium thermocellulolyticum TaxID=3170016 RepID=A0ABV2A5M7_9GAMM
MVKRTETLLESALKRIRVIRQGDIVQLVIDGGGALVTTTQDFLQAQKWASTKPATGNLVTDRGRLLEQIGALVSRPGSMVSTRGNAKQVEALAKLMKQGGYDLSEWMLPPELKNPQIPQPEQKPPSAPPPTDAHADR